MKFNKNYFKIYKDQFNYYNLIRKINPNYRLYFNEKNHQFYIINIYKNYEICKTFKAFSLNLINDLRFSRIENFNKILKYIDDENLKSHVNQEEKNKNISKYSLKEFNNLSNRSNSIKYTDINKIIGATKC